MRGAYREVPLGSEWVDGDMRVQVSAETVTIRPGSRQRGLPCIMCVMPAGGKPCHVLGVVAGILCPHDAGHLNAVGFFCHERCLPREQRRLMLAVARAIESLDH